MTNTPHNRPSFRPWLVLILAGLVMTACNDDGTEVQSGPITGTWVAEFADGTLYLVISSDSLVYYTAADAESCADRYEYGLEDLGENRYRLSSAVNTSTAETHITATDGELTWETGAGAAVFQSAPGADIGSLEICAGGGDDPSIVCTELPALQLAQDLPGELTQDDAMERDRYYDVYGFQPDAQVTAEVTLSSSAFDAYLFVYDADGSLLAENDDVAESSVDAAVTLTFVPACYRVEVTTFDEAATGPYTLRVE